MLNPTLEAFLSDFSRTLRHIHAHFANIETFETELRSATRDKAFWIRDPAAWRTMLHSRDAFVIHFASWAKDMYTTAFHRVAADTRGLYVRTPRTRSDPDYDIEVRRREAFERLFPASALEACGRVQHSDVVRLIDAFETRLRVVVQDRDANRAHPYESNKGDATILALGELGRALQYCIDLLNDLQLIATSSTHSFDPPPSTYFARTMVDLVLLHHDPAVTPHLLQREIDRTGKHQDERRRDAYQKLHAAHDECEALGEDELVGRRATLFNDPHSVGDVLYPFGSSS